MIGTIMVVQKRIFFRVLLDLLSPLGVKLLEKKGSSQSTLEKMMMMMMNEEGHER